MKLHGVKHNESIGMFYQAEIPKVGEKIWLHYCNSHCHINYITDFKISKLALAVS